MTGWIVQTLVASTLLMVGVAALRPLLRSRVPPRFIYALWLLPALRMVMPTLPLLKAEARPEYVMPIVLANAPTREVSGPDLILLLVILWLTGALLWLAWQWAGYWRFLRSARLDCVATVTPVAGIPVHLSGGVDGPVAVGILRRQIYVPLDFEARFDPQEGQCALAHEAMHHRRYDLLANMAAITVLALHWFNPIAHRAYRLFRADQELACDADVLRTLGRAQAETYARTLLKATAGGPAALCRLSEAALLKHRLRGLALQSPQRRYWHVTVLVPALGGAALLLSAATHASSTTPALRTSSVAGASPQAERPRPRADAGAGKASRPTTGRTQPTHKPTPAVGADVATGRSLALPIPLPSPQMLAAARGRPVDDPDYLSRRAEAGLARSQARYASPAAAAAARGRPIPEPRPSD
ncbi:M56 family metallopeptidase [Sphingomonas sp. CJ20]